jgi:hypothetical protein
MNLTPPSAPSAPSVLDAALAAAARGHCILPCWWIEPTSAGNVCTCPKGPACDSPGKHPLHHLVRHGLGEASSDANLIRSWWSRYPKANAALALARSGVIAFDLDIYKGDHARLEELCRIHGPLPETTAQLSGSQAGVHLIYQAPPYPIRGEIGGITLRGRNYIVIAPSSHVSGGRYTWLDGRDPVPLPPAWAEALRRPTTEGTQGVPAPDDEPAYVRAVSSEKRMQDALAHLSREPGEVKGVSQAGTAFNVCRSVIRGYALRDPADALVAILRYYNPRCTPPYRDEEVARRVVAAYEDATTPAWGSYYEPEPDKHRRLLSEIGLDPKPHVPGQENSPGQGILPVSTLEVRHAVNAAAKRMKRSTEATTVRDGVYLARVASASPLVETFDEDPSVVAVHTIRAAVRSVPANASAQQITDVLAASATMAGIQVDDLRAAVTHAMQEYASETIAAAAAEAEKARRASERTQRVDAARDAQRAMAIADAAPADDAALKAILIPNSDGSGVKACGQNLEAILRWSSATRGFLTYDPLAKALHVTDGPFKPYPINGLEVAIKNWLEKSWELYTPTGAVAEQILHVARTFGTRDPLVEYLGALRWDGVGRISKWLTTYCATESTPYTDSVGAMWLISAVARALCPGAKVDTVLVLEGHQGAKKSTALSVLGGEWFCDTPIDFSNKDSRLLAAQKWIVELAELASLRGRDSETLKAFLSARKDSFRPPYGRANEDFDRRCVFAGTTNVDEYLHDQTGARRFWSVKVGSVDIPALQRDRDQIWAEAVYWYQQGARWWFEGDEQKIADDVAEERRLEIPWASLLASWHAALHATAKPGPFSLQDIARALQIETKEIPRYQSALGQALRECGFVKRRAKHGVTAKGAARPWLWYPPDDEVSTAVA